jgi:hypothetical protein
VDWKRVVSRRPEGGRERQRKREPAENPRIPARDPPERGFRSDPTFRFRSDLDQRRHRLRVQILKSSRSRRLSHSLARERRRRTRGRGRGEVETLSRDFFFLGREIDLGLSFKKKKKKKGDFNKFTYGFKKTVWNPEKKWKKKIRQFFLNHL